jgi:hypothetical protein
MALLNPLGLLNNDRSMPVRVDKVPSGLACNCYCAKCGARFVAVHSRQRQWHFRHHDAEDCGGSYESAVHLMAKQVLVRDKCMTLPFLKVRPSSDLWRPGTCVTEEEFVVQRQLVTFDRVEDEVRMGERQSDVVAWKSGRRLLIEVFVTHDLSEEKIDWIRQNNFATVWVNLSWLGYDVDLSKIAKCLRDGRAVDCTPRFNIVRWIHHPRLAEVQVRVNEQYLSRIRSSMVEQASKSATETLTRQLDLGF